MSQELYSRQVALLLQVLPIIGEREEFAIKGGTAINLFIRNMPRLSVDVDLTYIPIQDRDSSLKGITAGLQAVAERLSVFIPKQQIKKIPGPVIGTFTTLVIETPQASVTVEVNHVLRGTVFPCDIGSLCTAAQEQFKADVQIKILALADLFGGKICAALDRQHARDLFDIKLLLENEGISTETRQAFVVYLVSHSRPMHELLNPTLLDVRTTFENEFQGMSRISVTYEELVKARADLLEKLKNGLSESERRFLLSVKEGSPQWNLLPISGIDRLPGVQWKIQNIQKMESRKLAAQLQQLKDCLSL
jgi:predicted nucleotidyltransferase component of viral defense system